MTNQILNDERVPPSADVLQTALGRSFSVFKTFIDSVTSAEFGLQYEWRYYKDGKAWLGKGTYKKKTVVWISVWEGFFKAGFYFTEKNDRDIANLKIDKAIKAQYSFAKPVGRLKPLAMDVRFKKQLPDLYTLINFKKTLK
jgi:hypothetical protein